MKAVTRIGLLIVLLAAAGIALVQQLSPPPAGGPRRGGPPSGEESSPGEGRRPPWAPPRGEVGRFSLFSMGPNLMLLDSANGDTWSFVADDTTAKGHWETINSPCPSGANADPREGRVRSRQLSAGRQAMPAAPEKFLTLHFRGRFRGLFTLAHPPDGGPSAACPLRKMLS